MKYLLDTHVLLWYLFEDEKLSPAVSAILKSLESEIYISAITFWEISVKFSTGKLRLGKILPDELPDRCLEYGFKIIPMSADNAASYFKLASTHHKDPFDRMLIWQAIQNDMILVTNDGNMPYYASEGLRLLW